MTQAIREKALGQLPDKEQFPLKGLGPDAPNSFRGRHQAFFSGTTGLIATQFGLDGMVTIGRLSTGIYAISFPKVKDIDIIPNLHCPTGFGYSAQVTGISGVPQIVGISGVAELRIFADKTAQTSQTGLLASGSYQPMNPVKGTYISLWFEGMPNSHLVPY